MLKKKREFTLKQLEERVKQWRYVIRLLIVLGLILLLVRTRMIKANKEEILLYVFGFLWIVGMIAKKKVEKLQNSIEKKKKQIRISTIKELAKDGNLKDSIRIINKEIVTGILSNNIKKITIDDIEGLNFVTSIHFVDAKFQSNVYIPVEKLISILDEESKKKMLEHLVNDIKIGNVEETTTEVQILSQNYLYTASQTLDEELLKLFDLKEE